MPINLADARAEALFVSGITIDPTCSRADLDATIRVTVRAHRGVRGCAAAMAAEYGDHPVEAAARMCRCRTAVAAAYGRRNSCGCGDQPLAVAA